MTSPDKVQLEQQHQQRFHLQPSKNDSNPSWQAQQQQQQQQQYSMEAPALVTGVGEMLRQTGASTTPPPPGFLSENPPTTSSGNQQQQHQYNASLKLASGSALSAEMEQMGGGHRTSSFVNLAAVLGTGLAESMDDAAKGFGSQQQESNHAPAPTMSSSLARQSRHAAARMIGASPPRGVEHHSSLGLDVAFFGAPPATLGGTNQYATTSDTGDAVPSSSASHQGISRTSNIANDTNNGKHSFGPYDSKSVAGGAAGGDYNSNSNYRSTTNNRTPQNNVQQTGYLSASFAVPVASAEAEDIFGNRRGTMPNSSNTNNPNLVRGDVGLTVMEPGGGATNNTTNSVLGNLMMGEQQQQVFCNDPYCSEQQQQPSSSSYKTNPYDQQLQHPQQPKTNNRLLDRDNNSGTFEVERGMKNLWVDDNVSVGQRSSRQQQQQQHQQSQTLYLDTQSVGGNSAHRSVGSQQPQTSPRQVTEADIRTFIWNTRQSQPPPPPSWDQYQQRQRQPEATAVEPSRCLVILRATALPIPEIRSICETFGVVELFRSDFAERGVIFVSYYDMRSAQYAALELESMLRRRDATSGARNRGTNDSNEIAVYYCVPLDSSTQTDESRLILADIPQYVDENSLLPMLSSYGAVRSLRRQGGYYGGASYEAEFHNVQDAKQALLELSSAQPWGPDVAVEVGMRQPIDRKRGRELLAMISRWRQQGGANSASPSSASSGSRRIEQPPSLDHRAPAFRGAQSSTSSSPALAAPSETQLVLGPDGRYSYMVVNNNNEQSKYGSGQSASDYYGAPHRRHPQPNEPHDAQRQQVVHGPNGEIYLTTVAPNSSYNPSHLDGGRRGGPTSREYYPPSSQQHYSQHQNHSHYSNAPYNPADGRDRLERVSGPYYTHQVGLPRQDHYGARNHPHHPHSSNASSASVGGDDKDNKNLILDLDGVEHARDTRTSLMVRNIPNKYTQQMLLAEFTENGLGPGVIDFFYLPIDFKNRCNRGYAFINFVDFKSILPFHQRYFGKHWSTFNSDKICDITYARIQGKAAMLKRFENSALMEKDEEYKPLVFVSHGPEKGKRIPFPEAASAVK